jgi:hypothetical protein
MNQCPPGPQVFHWGRFEFFRNFSEIFANEYDTGKKFIAGVNDTAEKLFTGVNDTANKLLTPAIK